jgi:hypothetical protein
MSAADVLLDRSQSYLLDLRHEVERPLTEPSFSDAERERAVVLGRILFAQLNALLKAALDRGDLETFRNVERKWSQMFDDVWLPPDPDSEDDDIVEALRPLLRFRDVLRLGLAMWAAHLLANQSDLAGPKWDVWSEALRVFSSRFEGIESLLDAYERANEGEERDTGNWTTWFLEELPSEEAHFIPTSQELLFATVLFAVRLAVDEQSPLRPREWLEWRSQEVESVLDRLANQESRWRSALGLSAEAADFEAPTEGASADWNARLERVRRLFQQSKEEAAARAAAVVRESPLDEVRTHQLRTETLKKARESRLLRDVFFHQGGLRQVSGPGDRVEALVSRSWIRKDFLTPSSRVVGLDMMARDLARATAQAESEQLLAAVSDLDPTPVRESITEEVTTLIDGWRDEGGRPSLLILPLGRRLREALGLRVWGGADISEHPLIPPVHRRRFDGVFHDVPVLDVPKAPKDRLFLLDLVAAAEFLEWPSENDAGIRIDLETLDADRAQSFLAEHPEVRAANKTVEQAVLELQERVLLTVRLCWAIIRKETPFASAIGVPEELRRD